MTRNKENQYANRGNPLRGKPFITYEQRVNRAYPAAKCEDDGMGWTIFANNGTGNVLAFSAVSELDAWKRAAASISDRRP